MKTIRYKDIVTTFTPSWFHSGMYVVIQENVEGVLSSLVLPEKEAERIFTELDARKNKEESHNIVDYIAKQNPYIDNICKFCGMEQSLQFTVHGDSCIWVRSQKIVNI